MERAWVGSTVEDEAHIEDELVAGVAAVADVHGVADEAEAEGRDADQLPAEVAGRHQMIGKMICDFWGDEVWWLLKDWTGSAVWIEFAVEYTSWEGC
jgi:hypothetical protein